MVLLKTLLVMYAKNDKQNSNKSVQSFCKIDILKNFAKFTRKTCPGISSTDVFL